MRHRLVAVAAAVCLAVAGCSSTPAKATRYAALGDSYAAGILTGEVAGKPAGCLRSDDDYPHLVQHSVRASTFADVTCSGATTANVTTPQHVVGGVNPPQLDAVTKDTTLVTITLGGNDIGFLSIIARCASVTPHGSPCKDAETAGGTDRLAALVSATAPKVAAVLAAVHARAPDARILLVGYPALLPRSGGCWPEVPFTNADADYLRGVEVELNAMLAAQARADHAEYVDTYTPSLGHGMCAPSGSRWVEPLLPSRLAAPFHPNAVGERHMADAVLTTLGRTPG